MVASSLAGRCRDARGGGFNLGEGGSEGEEVELEPELEVRPDVVHASYL